MTFVDLDHLAIEALQDQCAELRQLIGLLAQRVTFCENRPISDLHVGSCIRRVYDQSVVEEFNRLFAEGEATIDQSRHKL